MHFFLQTIHALKMNYWLTLSLLLIALLSSNKASAQNKSRFRVGPEVALGISLYPKTPLGSSALLGSHIGIKTTYRIGRHFSIYGSISYTQKKLQYVNTYTEITPSLNSILSLLGNVQNLPFDPVKAFNTDSKITVNGLTTAQFIEIPILCSYNYEGVVLFAGPYIGFLSSIKDKQIKETSIPFVETLNYKEIAGGFAGSLLTSLSPPAYSKVETTSTATANYNKIDFGFSVGLGYQFKNANLNVSYTHGLLDYRKTTPEAEKKVSYKTLRFSIVYLFEFKRKRERPAAKSSEM
jgi:hypothetical protein